MTTPKKTPSHRNRFLAGLVAAALLGLGIGYWLLQTGRESIVDARERRKATASLLMLVDLVERAGGKGDQVRQVVGDWVEQAPAKPVSAAVVLFDPPRQLEAMASTQPTDFDREHPAPRQLLRRDQGRDEKPLYDQAQTLRSAVATNHEGVSSTKREIDLAAEDHVLMLAAPLQQGDAVMGAVRIQVPVTPVGATPIWPALLAGLLPVAVVLVILRWLPEKRTVLFAVTGVALAAGLLGFAYFARGSLQQELRAEHQQVSETVKQLQVQAAKISNDRGIAASQAQPGSWDADAYRRPYGFLKPSGDLDAQKIEAQVARADADQGKVAWGIAALSLFVLAIVGFGAVSRTAAGFWKYRTAYGYVFPAMVGMILLVFFPFIYGVTLSFTSSSLDSVHASPFDIWIGLQNYVTILTDWQIFTITPDGSFAVNFSNFYYTFLFNVFWTVTNVAIGVTSGLILALVLNTKGLALRPIYRVILILPWATPTYITALIWRGMFHRQYGVMNNVLAMFGVDPLSWFDSPVTSYLTALTTNAWLSFPFMMVVSLGALQSIPADIYEAARVDGATRWQQFKAITLPSLKPALVPAIILSVVWTFNQFNVIYLVTGGEPGGATDILVTQAYKFAFQQYKYGYAAAYSTVIFGVLLVYGVFQNRMTKASEGV